MNLVAIAMFVSNLYVADIAFAKTEKSVEAVQTSAGSSASTNDALTAQGRDPVAVHPPQGLVPENLIWLEDTAERQRTVFLADKYSRTLTLWAFGRNPSPELLGAYAMDIGKKQGDKVLEGDHRTPEGIYFFQDRLEGNGLDFNEYGKRAFTLDYPNFFDVRARKTGSGIWLHAVPETKSLLRGSRGCVVVRNEVIEVLTPHIELKRTPMLIVDRVNYVEPRQLASRQSRLRSWLESWRKAWESKDLDSYMSFYSSNFSALKMNKAKWREYKDGLNKKYSSIRVHLEDAFYLTRGDDAVVSFVQNYDSDVIQDVGEKTLYINESADQPEILTELWRPVDQALLAHKRNGNLTTTDN